MKRMTIGAALMCASLVCAAMEWSGDVTISGTDETFAGGSSTIGTLTIKDGGGLDVVSGKLTETGLLKVGTINETARLTLNGGSLQLDYKKDPAVSVNGPLDAPSRIEIKGGEETVFTATDKSTAVQVGHSQDEPSAGAVVQTGGKVTLGSYLVLARYLNNVGSYTMTGGTLDQRNSSGRQTYVGQMGEGTFTLSGDTTTALLQDTRIGTGHVNVLTGATLRTSAMYGNQFKGAPATDAHVLFDGGTFGPLAAAGTYSNLLHDVTEAKVGAGGVTLDAPKNTSSTISQPLTGAGGIVKTGEGEMRLTGADTLAGGTDVRKGVLAVKKVSAPVTVAADATFVAPAEDFGVGATFASGAVAGVDVAEGEVALEDLPSPVPSGVSLAKYGAGGLLALGGVDVGASCDLFAFEGSLSLGGTTAARDLISKSSGRICLTNANATTTVGRYFVVGQTGTGATAEMSAGDVTAGELLTVGAEANSKGEFEMSGGTLHLGAMHIGQKGDAVVRQTGGDILRDVTESTSYTGDMYIGGAKDAPGVSADYYLSGGTLQVVNKDLHVGYYGTGCLYQTGGAITVPLWMTLARYSTGCGFYDLGGGTLDITGTGGGLVIGRDGKGEMKIHGTGVATVTPSVKLTHSATSSAALEISDGGTLETPYVWKGSGAAAPIVADGGTIRAKAAQSDFIREGVSVQVGAGGLTLDTGANDVTLARPTFMSDSPGALTKKGTGTLTLADTSVSYRGGTMVAEGTLKCFGASATRFVTRPSANQTVAMLAHRWSFNGDLKDAVTGASATYTGTATLAYTADGKALALPGGASGTGYVNLGSNLMRTDGPVTLEFWATERSVKKWARIFDIGSGETDYAYLVWTRGTETDDPRFEIRDEVANKVVLQQSFGASWTVGATNHVAIAFIPGAGEGGKTLIRCFKHDASGKLVHRVDMTPSTDWSLADLAQTAFYLGHSQFSANYDANADYDEVRIWNAEFSEQQLAVNAAMGPDVLPAFGESELMHRWSFNGDLKDAVTGVSAAYAGTEPVAYTADGKAVSLPGGANGTGYVDLGRGNLGAGGPVTLEFWAKVRAFAKWARLFSTGVSTNDLMYYVWYAGSADKARLEVRRPKGDSNEICLGENYMAAPFEAGVDYHVALTIEPIGDGKTVFRSTKRNPATGEVLARTTVTNSLAWSLADLTQEHFYLGHSFFPADRDAAADYDEVRIWGRKLNDDEILKEVLAGPDVVPELQQATSLSPLTVAAGAVFEVGTYGVTLDALRGEGQVRGSGKVTVEESLDPAGTSIGTLTLDVPVKVTGEIVIDLGADGACDLVTGTGSLDVSGATLRIRNAGSACGTYTIADMTGGVTGRFAAVKSSKKYLLSQEGGKITVSSPGSIVIIR